MSELILDFNRAIVGAEPLDWKKLLCGVRPINEAMSDWVRDHINNAANIWTRNYTTADVTDTYTTTTTTGATLRGLTYATYTW